MTDLQLAVATHTRSSPLVRQHKCLASSETNQRSIFDLCSPETRIPEFHS